MIDWKGRFGRAPHSLASRCRRRSGWRRLPGEEGFTLVELLTAMFLAVIVIGGTMTFIIVSLNQANSTSSRTIAGRQAEVGLAQLTRDLREAQYVTDSAGADTTPVSISNSAGIATVSFYLPTAGSPSVAGSQITWTCTPSASCTRRVGAGTAVAEIRGVTSATFTGTSTAGVTVTANPALVAISVAVQVTNLSDRTQTQVVAGTTNSITLQDGVALRNYS